MDQGTGTYSFTGLVAGTTYHFQIWAYSNADTDIDYLTDTAGPTVSVATLTPVDPEPDNQPTGFTTTAVSPDQIDLSWTDATGANAPTGYVIYANETGTFSAPTDGTAPVGDDDLSNGSAVVTVAQGTGTYSFTGLVAGTTYHFQIWAYSNAGTDIDYLTDTAGPTVSVATLTPVVDAVLFEEGFETDGHNTRYTASSGGGFYNGVHSFFFRFEATESTTTPIRVTGRAESNVGYSGFSGSYFWAAEGTASGGDGNPEQTIVFAPIDIAGWTGLSFSGRFALGALTRYRPGNYVRVTAQIGEGAEMRILCFEYQDDGPPEENQPLARDMECDGTATPTDEVLAQHVLTPYTADIPVTGDLLTLRIKVNVETSAKEIAFDDIIVSGLPAPEPDNQPTDFTAMAEGLEIDLSWADATGTNAPTGYVIYANETGTFSAPTDGTAPTVDEDLSDGTAVVTVNHGAGSAYSFSSLTALTTYHFKIWAYSNEGININYLTAVGPTTSVTTGVNTETVVFEEGFETDGDGTRYTAQAPILGGTSSYFRRTDGTDINGAQTGITDTWFWAAAGVSSSPAMVEIADIAFDNINISTFESINISGLFGVGALEGSSAKFDRIIFQGSIFNYDHIRVSYDIDEMGEMDAFCFSPQGAENPGTMFINIANVHLGLDTDCSGTADNLTGTTGLLTPQLREFSSSDIPVDGNFLTVRIYVSADLINEQIAFDDIRVKGALVPTIVTQEITGDAGWRLLSLPKAGGTVADIADNTSIQGITGGTAAGADPNFVIYDDRGLWEIPANVGTAWGDGYGFALYFYNNTDAGSTELPLTLNASGVEPSSDVGVRLNSEVVLATSESEPESVVPGSYFTLAGNPFSSNFDVSTITQTGDPIQNNIHVWNNGTSSYSTEDRTTPYIVSPWQGFWVEVFSGNINPTTAIAFPTSGKTDVDATGTFFSKEATNRGDIAFALSSQTTYDEALRLSFRETATRGHDVDDASKLRPLLSEYATMAFNSNGVLKSVESLPWELTEEITVPMEEDLVGVSGSFTLAWKGLESVPADWGLTFHDYDTGINSDMRSVSEYTFDVASLAKAQVNPLSVLTGPAAVVQKSKTAGTRFAVTITPHTANTEGEDRASVFALEQNYPNPFNPSTVINYSVANRGKVSLSVYNLLGQRVAQLVNETKAAGSYNVTWNATAAASGMYYYRLEAGGQTLIRKMILIK